MSASQNLFTKHDVKAARQSTRPHGALNAARQNILRLDAS